MTLEAGDPAPEFTALDQHGEPMNPLRASAGRWLLLWWYPKALTPGCTSCGQGFQARLAEFAGLGCEIVGVSFDPPERNLAFVRAERFAFPLLSASYDVGRVYGTKRDDGEEWADVPRRLSFLIDPTGTIRATYRVLDPTQHPAQVLTDLRELRTPAKRGLRRLLSR